MCSSGERTPWTMGRAALMLAPHLTVHRAAIDVSLPLPPTWKHHAASLRPLPVGKRRYLLAFMGAQYLLAFMGARVNPPLLVHSPASLLTSPLPPSASFPPFPSPLLLSLPTSSNHPNQVLTAGAIPVVVADTRKLPFDDIIPWHRCLLVFPTSLLSRIEPTLRAITPVPPNPLSNPPVPWNRLCAPCTCYLPPSCLAPSP
ncbi:unnamed protein product [Closterium sp. NIES-54]